MLYKSCVLSGGAPVLFFEPVQCNAMLCAFFKIEVSAAFFGIVLCEIGEESK